MAIMSQLFTPEEFQRLDAETQKRITAMVNAGGAVAEILDDAKVPPERVEDARFQRQHGKEIREGLKQVKDFEETRRSLLGKGQSDRTEQK